MNFQATSVFDRILAAYLEGKRLIVNEGGTSSSKTISTIQFLIFIAIYSKDPILISIVSETFPHLRRGCMRDFQMLMGDGFSDERWNKGESIYTFPSGSKIEFFSADQASKLRGGRRHILFENEANNLSKEAHDELDVRTRMLTIIDFNPVNEFWAHELKDRPEVAWIHSTFVDAVHVLEESVVQNILSRKDRDPNWWRIYGLGLVGKIEGLCHPFFFQFDVMPEKWDRQIYGLDFGYSMDPAVLVDNRIVGNTIYSRQLFYEKGMTNDHIAKRMEDVGVRKGLDIIVADSSEPKSIAEIKAFGYDIRPATKGSDSVNQGIQKVNQYKQGWSKDSLDCIKEQRNYRWDKDADGKFINKPIDDWNHCFVAGTLIETDRGQIPIEKIKVGDLVLTSHGFKKVLQSGSTGNKEVHKYLVHGIEIECTADHLFYTSNRGFVEIQFLTQDDILCILSKKEDNICGLKYLSGMVENIEDIQNQKTCQTENILAEEKQQEKKEVRDYMLRCGKAGMEKFLLGSISTTLIKTGRIIVSKIFPWKKRQTISAIIPEQATTLKVKNIKIICGKSGRLQYCGIKQKREWPYTKSLATWLVGCLQLIQRHVFNVMLNTKSDLLIGMYRNFVQINAKPNIAGKMVWTMKGAFVKCAEKCFKLINTRRPHAVQSRAQINCGEKPVFNLEVEDCPEYFANGILVHNCMDSRRYAVATIPEAKVLPPAIRIEPFALSWDVSKVPEKECLHYATACMTEDLALHILCAVWDCIEGILYVYHAERVENVTPITLVQALVQIMRLNEFYFERFLANDRMLSDDKSMARVINKEFQTACFRQQIKLRAPKRFDPFGAIGLTNQMIQQRRLVINEACIDMVTDMQTWQVEGGKVKIEGLREGLVMLVSELDTREAIRPHLVTAGYKKLWQFQY